MKQRILGSRAIQVLNLLILGYSNQQIGKALDMARRTVKAHLSRAFVLYDIDYAVHVPSVRLAILVLYERNPELKPFFDGDRASQWGYPSAADNLRTAAEIDAYHDIQSRSLKFIRNRACNDQGKGRT
jgi:hypothetical protein